MSDIHRLILADTSLGPLTLVASETGLRRLRFGRPSGAAPGEQSLLPGQPHPVLRPAAALLTRALAGESVDWSPVPLELDSGTEFQRAVWEALREIPLGSVISYGQLTRTLDRGSPRAVGQAVGANPIPVIVPCHRVVTEDGRLGGFSGGLDRKVQLLALEGIHSEGAHADAHIEPEPALRLAL